MFRTPKIFLLLLALVSTLTACSISPVDNQTLSADKSYADFSGITPEVNQPAPQFYLPSGDGKQVGLADFKGKQPVLILFYRGNWCPYCMDQLDNYQALLPELEKHQIQLIAISTDDESAIKNNSRRFGQKYIFLSDRNLAVTRQYGIGNKNNLPHPALFLVDKQGDLIWYYASSDYKVRPTAGQVEAIIKNKFPDMTDDRHHKTISIKLGDFHFSPDRIKLVANQPTRLVLVNTDSITPHNFTLIDKAADLNIDLDIAAGKTREIEIIVQKPGTYHFFCNKKLPLMKSHQDRGMQGSLTATTDQ